MRVCDHEEAAFARKPHSAQEKLLNRNTNFPGILRIFRNLQLLFSIVGTDYRYISNHQAAFIPQPRLICS